MRFALWMVSVILLIPAPAQAWNRPGHMVTAAIMYDVLKHEHPDSIPKIVAILREHPQYDVHWAHKIAAIPNMTDENKDIYLFMLAARWPDDIRKDSEYDHPEWHYINLPYHPPGHAPSDQQPHAPKEDNIVRAFELNKSRAKTGSAAERAVAICWLMHLIGDCHQPLHTSNLYSKEYPQGDHGGNLFYIRGRENSEPIGLHKFWDDLIIGTDRFQSVHNEATQLRLRPEFAKDKLNELQSTNFEHWIKDESFKLVDSAVYRHGTLKGGTTKENAQVLPEDYPKAVKHIAERRVVLAGYRMADVVRQAAE